MGTALLLTLCGIAAIFLAAAINELPRRRKLR
jgi:hypothetical protein